MMKNSDPIFAYQQSYAHGASPVGQVVALYDTIVRDFRRALAAIEKGDAEARVFETNHALAVVAHLQNVLDQERGGEAAKRLKSFYEVTRALIMEAGVNSSRETLGRLIELYSEMRDAWHQVELQLPAAQKLSAPVAPRINVPAGTLLHATPAHDPDEAPRGNWSA